MNLKKNMWFVYAVAAGLLWGVFNVLAKFISLDPYVTHVLFSAGVLCTLPFVIRKCTRSCFNAKGFLWACLAAVFAIAGNIALFYAFVKGGQASIVTPVTNLYPLITILIAVAVFKERLNWINVVGILLAVPAILLLSGETLLFTDPAGFFKSIGLNEWFLFSLAAIVGWGVFSALQKLATNYISAEWSYAAFIFTSCVIAFAFLIAGTVHFNTTNKTLLLGTIGGMINGLGVLASFAAYRAEGKASAVTTIAGALQPVFTIVLAVLLLKENFTTVQFLGILLAIGGSLLLSYEKRRKPIMAT